MIPSVLPSSSVLSGTIPRSASAVSATSRVPEPGSRTRKRSASSSRGSTSARAASGWSAGATTTSSSSRQ
ncbi:MAG TPA: hypothetical protein VF263_20770, partial [Longimicrobiaceae bacterium]